MVTDCTPTIGQAERARKTLWIRHVTRYVPYPTSRIRGPTVSCERGARNRHSNTALRAPCSLPGRWRGGRLWGLGPTGGVGLARGAAAAPLDRAWRLAGTGLPSAAGRPVP